jgi:hypothetical protein
MKASLPVSDICTGWGTDGGEGSPGAGKDSPEINGREETGQYTALTRRALMVVADS